MVAFARGTHTELSKITEHCLCILSLALCALIHSVLQRVLKRMKLNDTESRKIDLWIKIKLILLLFLLLLLLKIK